jgi:hypothetical protein
MVVSKFTSTSQWHYYKSKNTAHLNWEILCIFVYKKRRWGAWDVKERLRCEKQEGCRRMTPKRLCESM